MAIVENDSLAASRLVSGIRFVLNPRFDENIFFAIVNFNVHNSTGETPGSMTHSLVYVVCATPRTGSNLLAEGLRTVGAGYPIEYFHSDYWKAEHRDKLGQNIWSEEFLTGWIQQAVRSTSIFGIKLHWFQAATIAARLYPCNDCVEQVGILFERVFPNVRFIWMRRSDTVRQAISYSIALQTGLWSTRGVAQSKHKYTRKPQFDAGRLRYLQTLLTHHDNGWASYFRCSRTNPLRVLYEDLDSHYEATIRRTATFLGFAEHPEARIPKPQLREAGRINHRGVGSFVSPHAAKELLCDGQS